MKIFKHSIFIAVLLISVFWSTKFVRAMPPGALLYRTSAEGKMFGYSGHELTESEKGILKTVSSGHVGIYIGKENGIDYVVEALPSGVVKVPADKFVNSAIGEKYLGAKIPRGLTSAQQAKVVAIAKSLADQNLAYDFDFKKQKGYQSGDWTCVGLVEKIYESANISNPHNILSLEYIQGYYALDITPDGLDNYSFSGNSGDCFSRDYEFSKIVKRDNILMPAPELIGYNLGYEKNGDRYIFLPYTQFIQPTLSDIKTDINVISSFNEAEIRGSVNSLSVALRWSLINNPLSSLKIIADKAVDLAMNFRNKFFKADEEDLNFLEELAEEAVPTALALAKTGAIINKSNIPPNSSSTPTNFLEASDKTLASVTKTSSVDKTSESSGNYYSSAEEPIMSLITKAIKSGLETSASEPSSGVTASWAPSSTVAQTDGNKSVETDSSAAVNSLPPKTATISLIYATGNNDFIELYNPTDADFDLAEAGYRLERTKTAEDPAVAVRIGNSADGTYPGGTIIKARDTYLLVKESASAYFLDQADAIITRSEFSWPGDGYTIYLGTGAISSSQDPDIVEAVGFGPKATYFQGAAPASEIKDNYILKRVSSLNHNNRDFILVKSGDPSIDWSLPASSNLENASSSSASSQGNVNVNENVQINTTTVSTTTNSSTTTTSTIANNTSTTSSEMATFINNNQNPTSTSSTSTPDNVNTDPQITPYAIINAIYGTGQTDWLELYNPTSVDLDLAAASYRLEKTKTAEDPSLIMRIGNTADGLYPSGTIIKGGGKYLIVSDKASDYYKNLADAIATRTEFSWFNSGYTIYLGNVAINSSTDPDILDYVGFGMDAKYWQGAAPAPALQDNYILRRLATSTNNNLDFSLIRSDEPGIIWSDERIVETSSGSFYSFSENSYDLFPIFEPVVSSGIKHLWHFEDCYGEEAKPSLGSTSLVAVGNWLPGKFGCAKHNGYREGSLSAFLDEEIDPNEFSLSFWFKQTTDYPRLNLTLASEGDEFISLTLENNLIIVDGLATPSWRTELDFPFDGTWRQFTLVVNRPEGYWSIYVDGVKKYHVDTFKLLPTMNYLEIGGRNWDYGFDELAIWDRALPEEEVIYLREKEQPFYPWKFSPPQEKAVLKHLWRFNEAIGTSSKDLISGIDLPLNNYNWFSTSVNESYFTTQYGQSFSTALPPVSSPDFSLTFRWRSPDDYNDNRVCLSLGTENQNNIFSFVTSPYRPAFYLNGGRGFFDYISGFSQPHDTNWHNVALVYDSYRYNLNYYLDGELAGKVTYIWPPGRQPLDYLNIYPENWTSEIDDLGVWEGALTARQVKEISANN